MLNILRMKEKIIYINIISFREWSIRMKHLISAGFAFSLIFATVPALAAVEWCAVQTNNGKIVKCHTNPKSCERYVKGRFNWTCVAREK